MKIAKTSSTPAMATRQPTIEAFGRIGKVGVASSTPAEKTCNKTSHATTFKTQKPTSSITSQPKSSEKKHARSESGSDYEESENDDATAPAIKRRRTDEAEQQAITVATPQTPRKQRFDAQSLPTPEATPVKSLEFAPRNVQTTPSKQQRTRVISLKSPPASLRLLPQKKYDAFTDDRHLPEELEELVELHSSIMKALSIHLSHNGLASPVNVAMLLPTVTKIWRVRNVTLEDVRRVVGISQHSTLESSPTFTKSNVRLLDYNRGNVCIEWPESQTKLTWQNTTERLTSEFIVTLESLWCAHVESSTSTEDDIGSFMHRLPLARVPLAPTLKKTAPLFAKGQRRLDEFHVLARDAQAQAKKTVTRCLSSVSSKPDPRARASSLLERLLAKQAAATASNAPSKQELERRAALHRLPEIVSILSTLRRSASQQRQSHTLQSLVRDVQSSARSPLSREEVEASVRLLAEEVAVQGVRIVDTGSAMGEGCAGKGITAVLVDWPAAGDLAGKVRRAIDALDAA